MALVSCWMTGKRTSPVVAGVCFVLLASRISSAELPNGESDHAAQAIAEALHRHGADVNSCFAKVLADRLDTAGRVEVMVEVGKAGRVTAAKVRRSESAPAALATCVERAALTWTIDGIEAGASVVLPFSFKAQSSQYVVNGGDIPERSLGGGEGRGRTGPKRDAPFTVKVLADETNVKASGISLTQVNIGPASRVAMHRHPHSAKILYLLKGHARLLGPAGVEPIKLDEGTAVFIPSGYPHVIENMGRQSTAVVLQAFAPPGPERVYRDPTDARGRAEFEVIRDPSKVRVDPALASQVMVASAAEVKPEPTAKGKGSARILIRAAGPHPMALVLLDLSDGAELQSGGQAPSPLVHPTSVMYLVSGGGSARVGGEEQRVGPQSVLYLPYDAGYAIKAAPEEKGERTVVVDFSAAAPEKLHAPTGAPRMR